MLGYRTFSATPMFSATLAAATPCHSADGINECHRDSEETEAIVVSGILQSLEDARDAKRETDQFVDAIVADDIGKLPEANVAESLARVSGVQVERGVGEGLDILVRGLKENVILYKGRQIVDATGRGGNGLDQLNTGNYGLLELVPSELISRLQVTKLTGTEQIAGGLGDIFRIDLQ